MLQLVLLAFLVTTLSAETCNFNAIYNPSLEFCVFASQQEDTWEQAETRCKVMGGHLFSIHNSFQNELFAQIQKSFVGSQGWLGLLPDTFPSTWADGSPFDYQNVQHSTESADCLTMQSSEKSWRYKKCTAELPYLCALPPATLTSTTGQTRSTSSPTTTFLTTVTSSVKMCCPLNGTWSEWSPQNQCADYCGAAGNITYTRVCTSIAYNCPCYGPSTRVELCNVNVCPFPRQPCGPGRILDEYNNETACGPTFEINTPQFNDCLTTCCPDGGIWSAWVNVSPLQPFNFNNHTLFCGMCATQEQTRKCLSAVYGCPCDGPTTQTMHLTDELCQFPVPTCCSPYIKKLNITQRKYTCQLEDAPVELAPIVERICCPPDGNGLWNDWSDWSICSATCGLCGTQIRTRTCASQPYGCPCTGNSMEVRRCGALGCTGKPCCDGTYEGVAYDGTIFCQLEPPITFPGTWQPWFATSFCNDTCGMCGTMTQARYCMPTGSQCNGNFTQQIACGDGWCSSPKPPCCPGFMKSQNPITNAGICVP